jgi:hypothetical protein
MVGQCDASLYNTIAEMIPGITEVAEIWLCQRGHDG